LNEHLKIKNEKKFLGLLCGNFLVAKIYEQFLIDQKYLFIRSKRVVSRPHLTDFARTYFFLFFFFQRQMQLNIKKKNLRGTALSHNK